MMAERPLTTPSLIAQLSARFGQDATRLAVRLRNESPAPHDDARLLSEGVPEGHVLGSVEFCGLLIACERGVFTPRRSTADLIWRAALHIDPFHYDRDPVVIDIGTGTGVIALALAAVSEATCVGVDIDPAAVALAQRNALALSLEHRARFQVGDVRNPALARSLPTADVLVCNPPYVPDRVRLPVEVVEHQPSSALYSGPDGMDVTRACIRLGLAIVRPGGLLVLEHDPGQRGIVEALAKASGGWIEQPASGDGITMLRRDQS